MVCIFPGLKATVLNSRSEYSLVYMHATVLNTRYAHALVYNNCPQHKVCICPGLQVIEQLSLTQGLCTPLSTSDCPQHKVCILPCLKVTVLNTRSVYSLVYKRLSSTQGLIYWSTSTNLLIQRNYCWKQKIWTCKNWVEESLNVSNVLPRFQTFQPDTPQYAACCHRYTSYNRYNQCQTKWIPCIIIICICFISYGRIFQLALERLIRIEHHSSTINLNLRRYIFTHVPQQ